MADSRDSIADYLRLPEGNVADVFWVLGAFLVLLLGALLLRRWLAFRRKGHRRKAAAFHPAEAIAELARLSPNSAEITVIRDAKGIQIEKPAGRAPLLKRDGALVHRKGRFYIGPPTGRKGETAAALRGRGEIIIVEFYQRGVRHHLEGQVVSRRRLSVDTLLSGDMRLSERYAVVPVSPLQQEEQRGLMRHYLKAETGDDVACCPYLDFQLFVHRTDWQLPDFDEMPAKMGQVKLIPYGGSTGFEEPAHPEMAVEEGHDDVRQIEGQGGYPAEVVDFSATGLRLETDVGVLDYLLPGEEKTDDLDIVLEKLGTQALLLDFYPEFRFPPTTADAVPVVPSRFQLIGQVVRVATEEERDERHLRLGVHFIYEPQTCGTTGMPMSWYLLHGNRESEVLLEINQAINQLQAILQSDSLRRQSPQSRVAKPVSQDPEVAEEVRNQVFLFADIAKLTDREIQAVMRQVDQKDLIIALNGTEEAVRDKLLGNMSERVRNTIAEEMEFSEPMCSSEVEEVQLRIVQQMRQTEGAGTGNQRAR